MVVHARSSWFAGLLVLALVLGVGIWHVGVQRETRMAAFDDQREELLAAIEAERAQIAILRAQQRHYRGVAAAAKPWRALLLQDRATLGRHVVASLQSGLVQLVEMKAVEQIAGGPPELQLRWRGSYAASLAALTDLAAGAAPVRVKSLVLRHIDGSANPARVEAEAIVAAGSLPAWREPE